MDEDQEIDRGGKGKGIKMHSVHVPIQYKEFKHYVLWTCTKESRYLKRSGEDRQKSVSFFCL